MDLPDLTSLGTLGVPAFVVIFVMGWTACRIYLVKPLEKRIEILEARDEAYRKGVDEELRAYRGQRVLG